MSTINSKTLYIAVKNVKEKIRDWHSMFWTLLFPIMMLVVYHFAFGNTPNINGKTSFDVSFPGIVVYTIGTATITSAVMFSLGKKNGTLELLDTMPIGRANLFVGAMISEAIFMQLQLIIIFIFGYGVFGAHLELNMFFIAYLIAMVYGIGAIGLGLIIASLVKTPQAANGFGMMYLMTLMFASGSFFPIESVVVYFTPQYWVKQVYLQLTVLGNSFSEQMYSGSLVGYTSEPISIPLWGGLLVIIAFTAIFTYLGIKIFQKKTTL